LDAIDYDCGDGDAGLNEEGKEVSSEQESNLGAEDYGRGDEETDEELGTGLRGMAEAWPGKRQKGAECIGC